MNAPKGSDICISIRSVSAEPKPNASDPDGQKTLDNALALIEEIRPDRIEWSYTWKQPEFGEPLKAACSKLVPAINTIAPPGAAVDFEGEPCIAPWMTGFGQPDKRLPYICMNNPQDVAARVEQVTSAIASGYDTAVQYDDWLGNMQMLRWGSWRKDMGMKACFCEHCRNGFREYLSLDLDYRAYLRQRGINTVHELQSAVESNKAPLWEDYVRYQRLTVQRHLRTIRAAISRATAGPVALAVNALASQDWDNLLPGHVEYLNGETHDISPTALHTLAQTAKELGVVQVSSFFPRVPAEEYHSPDFVLKVRRSTAVAYALGMVPLFPYDVYAGDQPRWFGRWEEYAREYDFVREHREWFDSYAFETFEEENGKIKITTVPTEDTGRPRLRHAIQEDAEWTAEVL